MPTRYGPCPRSASTISQVCRYFRVGLSLSDSQTTEPGSVRPIIEPVFGQVAVTVSPLSSSTSARNLLYRRRSRPRIKGEGNRMAGKLGREQAKARADRV